MTDNNVYEVPDSDDEKDDPDLAKAIAMSLDGSQSSASENLKVVDVEASGSRSRQEAPQAIATTKRKLTHVDLTLDDEDSVVSVKVPKLDSETTVGQMMERTPSGFGALDRKAMEKERLERIRKTSESKDMLSASTSKTASSSRGEDARETSTPVGPQAFYGGSAGPRWRAVQTTRPAEKINKSSLDASHSSKPSSSHQPLPSNLKYPNGIVKKTWAEGRSRSEDDITIEEVLQKRTLTTCLLSAFQWDLEWLGDKLPLGKQDFRWVLVMQGKTEEEKQARAGPIMGLPKVDIVFPDMSGQINCMHSKLMLLFHKEGKHHWLRIAVPTANLTNYDWGHLNGVMENMVFIIDLPGLSEPQPEQTLFLDELLYFAAAQGIPETVLSQLVSYDFRKTASMAFVHSIGGSSSGDNWKRTGYCGLGRSIKKLGYACGRGLEVDYVTSSLGSANEQFISNIYRAAMGDDGVRELQRRSNKKVSDIKKKRPENESTDAETSSEFEEETEWEHIKSRFRIYFPSHDTVNDSRGALEAAGTICFQQQWWNSSTFPRNLVHDCKSVRTGLLMHNKLLFARPAKQLNTPYGDVDAWAYIGSANLSESAWGKLITDRSTKSPKINCKNWECGVVFPVFSKSAGQTLSGKKVTRTEPVEMQVFKNTIPVPMEVPSEPLNNREPWFFQRLSSMFP